MQNVTIVMTTMPDRDGARLLAEAMVETRLAACAQLTAIESVFRWEGITSEAEVRIDFKTAPDRAEALMAAIQTAHPYETPEVLVTEAMASDGYGAWAYKETRPPQG